jgi:hypothetical protein
VKDKEYFEDLVVDGKVQLYLILEKYCNEFEGIQMVQNRI